MDTSTGGSDQPEPGHREPAPGALAVVQAFVNTNDIEEKHDQLGDSQELRGWLRRRGGLGANRTVSRNEWRRAIDVREGLRALGAANNELPVDSGSIGRLGAATTELGLVPRLDAGSRWRLEPRGEGVDRFLELVLAITVAAMADGTWKRMKACQADSCRWLFYDHSRNRSGAWCTMAICGARAKARAYRARKRGSPAR